MYSAVYTSIYSLLTTAFFQVCLHCFGARQCHAARPAKQSALFQSSARTVWSKQVIMLCKTEDVENALPATAAYSIYFSNVFYKSGCCLCYQNCHFDVRSSRGLMSWNRCNILRYSSYPYSRSQDAQGSNARSLMFVLTVHGWSWMCLKIRDRKIPKIHRYL